MPDSLSYLYHNLTQMRFWAREAERLAAETERRRGEYIERAMGVGADREMPTRRIDAIQMWETDKIALNLAGQERWAHMKWDSYAHAVLAEKAAMDAVAAAAAARSG